MVSGISRRSALPLADRVMAAVATKRVDPRALPNKEREKIGDWLRTKIINARRFSLDDETTLAVQELGVKHPDLLHQMLRSSHAPFPLTWMEWPLDPLVADMGDDPDRPDRTGVFVESIDDERPVYRMTPLSVTQADGESPGIGISPFSVVYDLHRDDNAAIVPVEETREINAFMRWPSDWLVPFLLGRAYLVAAHDKAEVATRQQQCAAIARHASLGLTPVVGSYTVGMMQGRYNIDPDRLRAVMLHNMREEVGTWRFVVAALALLNRRNYVESSPWAAGKGRRFVGGKLTPYLQHYVTKLVVPRDTVIQRVTREVADVMPRPMTPVVGHYRHSRRYGDPTCEHAYALETPNREVCVVCGAKRWRVRGHYRGDPTVGFITKDYRVETRE